MASLPSDLNVSKEGNEALLHYADQVSNSMLVTLS